MTSGRPARKASVWVLPLDSGCGACVRQVYALQSSRYAHALAAHGIRFARSPRHADVVLVTGPLAEAARAPLRRVLSAVPEPRALVAVGNCAIDGCVFRGGAHIADDASEMLDVNVEIAGCPPAPEAILDAIAEAALLLAGDSGTSSKLDATATDEAGEADESDETDESVESDAAGDAADAGAPAGAEPAADESQEGKR